MENLPANVQNNLPTLAPQPESQVILNTNIIIPQLLVMQGLSDFIVEKQKCPVTGKKIETGMFVRSSSMEILGGEDKPIRFIPLKMVDNWKIEEKINGKFEHRRTEPRTPSNEMLDWNFKHNGADWRRVKVMDVFALLPQDILAFQSEIEKLQPGELPDLNKMLLPVMIRLKSTSFNAGKSVATLFAQIRDLTQYKPDIRAYHYTMELSTFLDKNDSGTFYVFRAGDPKPLDQKLLPEATRWFNNLAVMSNVRVDESADTENPTQPRF